MGIREELNQHKLATIAVVLVIVVAAAGAAIWQVNSKDRYAPFGGVSLFSTDDGKTWFTDKADQFPPFTHEGKTAYRAYVFTCDGGKTKWVGYLERCTPQGKKEMAELRSKLKGSHDLPSVTPELLQNIEIKRPGEATWVRQGDVERAARILSVKCPHSGQHEVDPVIP